MMILSLLKQADIIQNYIYYSEGVAPVSHYLLLMNNSPIPNVAETVHEITSYGYMMGDVCRGNATMPTTGLFCYISPPVCPAPPALPEYNFLIQRAYAPLNRIMLRWAPVWGLIVTEVCVIKEIVAEVGRVGQY